MRKSAYALFLSPLICMGQSSLGAKSQALDSSERVKIQLEASADEHWGSGRHELEVDGPLATDPILVQRAYIKASNPSTIDYFGRSVAVSGNTVVVGAYLEDSGTTGVDGIPDELATDSGAVYVFSRSGTTWTQQAYLKPSNTGAHDQFGWSVAISGDILVVGAYLEDSSTTGIDSTPNELAENSGAAYVFSRSGDTWTQQAYLKASNTGAGDLFGHSVAISGDNIVVGAMGEANSAGAAYAFDRSGGSWTQRKLLKASNPAVGDNFGASVAISGDTAVVGANGEDSSTTGVNSIPNENAPSSGAAYVFERGEGSWTQPAVYLKPSNTGHHDQFGWSVAISGDTVVVGAFFEDSSSTGVNSTPNDSAENSGAAYVFSRTLHSWAQQAYLKASNTSGDDQFGHAVAISGNTVVVGARGEGSSPQVLNAGAAYVFTRSGNAWSQQSYLKPLNPGVLDEFGHTVAISENTVAVGAGMEDSSSTGVDGTPDELALDSGAAYVFGAPGFSIGGFVSGLAGSGLVLLNNAADNLPIDTNGDFTFASLLTDGNSYSVSVLSQPSDPNQSCSVINGAGLMGGADVSDVSVVCIDEQVFDNGFEVD